jgi:hypothetical protein
MPVLLAGEGGRKRDFLVITTASNNSGRPRAQDPGVRPIRPCLIGLHIQTANFA